MPPESGAPNLAGAVEGAGARISALEAEIVEIKADLQTANDQIAVLTAQLAGQAATIDAVAAKQSRADFMLPPNCKWVFEASPSTDLPRGTKPRARDLATTNGVVCR